MANSGIYFITYEIFGAKFVKIGRSCDVKKRRNELQGGCPVELAIEHVKVLPGEDAIDTERRWQALFETMSKRAGRTDAVFAEVFTAEYSA